MELAHLAHDFGLTGMTGHTKFLLRTFEQRDVPALVRVVTGRALSLRRGRVRVRLLGLFRDIPMARDAEFLYRHGEGRTLGLVCTGMTGLAFSLNEGRMHGGLDQAPG